MMQPWLQKRHQFKLILAYFVQFICVFARKLSKSCKINDILLDKPLKIVYNTFRVCAKETGG